MAPRPDLVVCEECEAVWRRMPLQGGQEAHCARCGALIGRGHRLDVAEQLALTVAALVFFALANLYPIVTLEFRGMRNHATLFEAIDRTWRDGQALVAVLAAATAFVFPLIVMALRLYVLAPLAAGRVPPAFVAVMHVLRFVTRWSMVEVFMLGVLVAVVRSAGLAAAIPGPGVFSFGALTLLLAANVAAGLHRVWQHASELPA